ncbi:MAG: M20/M25/M40 family metallo-hydrolase [Enterocloster asparagiformis]|nr:M20/M25/M40 family metallo-hydrolase [Enterocloster asparagiformis]
MRQVYETVRKSVGENKGRMIALLEKIVNIDSGSTNIAGVEAVCEILRQEMEDIGMDTRVIPSEGAGPVLIGERRGEAEKRPLLFIGHMDTVFEDGEAEANPFRIDEEGLAHGPGVLDMKGGLVIALFAVRALRDIGYTGRPVKCIFVGDEEKLHMFSKAKDIIISELAGAEGAFNFEVGYRHDGLVVGRKGGGIVDVTVQGVAAHSGLAPEKGRSAVTEMCHKVIELESKRDIARGKLINCGMVSGGIGENTVPGEAKISIGIRFPSLAVRDEILEDIRSAAEHVHIEGTRAQMSVRMMMESMDTTAEVMGLFEHIQKVAGECGYGDVHPFTVGGVSDSGVIVANGVPAVCGMGAKGEGCHTRDEYAVADSLVDRAVLAACAAYAL